MKHALRDDGNFMNLKFEQFMLDKIEDMRICVLGSTRTFT